MFRVVEERDVVEVVRVRELWECGRDLSGERDCDAQTVWLLYTQSWTGIQVSACARGRSSIPCFVDAGDPHRCVMVISLSFGDNAAASRNLRIGVLTKKVHQA